jgi:hypothetical protein
LHRLGSLLVPEESLQAPFTRPAPIPVHDDRHMMRQALRIQTAVRRCLVGGQFMNSAGID